MKSHLVVAAGLVVVAAGVAVGDDAPPAPKPIHFLALHLPKNLQASFDHIKHDVQNRIKEKYPSAAAHIHYHAHADRHISLVRFAHIAQSDMPVYRDAIAAAVKHIKWGHDHPFNLAAKVHGKRKLHVTDDGWITLHIDRSDTLAHFAKEVAAAVHKKHPKAQVGTDFPDHGHISIARADSGVSLEKLRSILGGHAYDVKCDKYEVHHIHLKHSVGVLQYKEDATFPLPGYK